jgi:hypothetical protein
MATFWADGSAGEERLMQIRVWLHVTNLTSQPLQLSKARLYFRRRCILSDNREGDIDVRHPDVDQYGKYPILPRRMSEASATWMISPPFQVPNKPVFVRVGIVDQFGNEQWSGWIKVPFVGDTKRFH